MIRILRQWSNRFRALRGLDAKRAELDSEIEHHLELLAADFEREGMSPARARREARMKFGGVESLKEECRDSWGVLWLENVCRDFKYAFRRVLNSPGFSSLVVATLALGIGACATIYSVLQATVLKPLPVESQEELFVLWENHPERGIERFSVSVPNFEDFREMSDSVCELMAVGGFSANSTDGGTPTRYNGNEVTAGYMKTLGWQPTLGREFRPEEDAPGARRVVMISERLWRELFAGNIGVVGETLTLNREPHEIVGVFGDSMKVFAGAEIDVARPLAAESEKEDRDNHVLTVVGRLKPGVSMEQAQAEFDRIAAQLGETYPDSNDGWGAFVEPFYEVYVPANLRRGLYVIFAAVGALLLIACANVANLLLTRSLARDKEIAVRLALGASRFRVARQLLSESALFCVFGAFGGMLVAIWGVGLVGVFAPEELPRADSIELDLGALAFVAMVCVATIVVSGLVPALRGSQADPARALGGASRALGASPSGGRLRAGLVVLQLSLSLSLVVGAGLLIKSFNELQRVNPGFDAKGLLTFRMTPDGDSYGDQRARLSLFERVLDELSSVPGVESAGMTSSVPFGPGRTGLNVFSPDPSSLEPGKSVQAGWRIICPNYFDTMGIPLLEGRSFTRFDTGEGRQVMVVSRELAKRFWPNESAIGKRMDPGGGDNYYTIVGVVGDARLRSLSDGSNPAMYFPVGHWWGWSTMNFVVRASVNPEALADEIRQAVLQVDASQPIFELETMRGYLEKQVQTPRLNSWLLGIFAGIALTLAAIGTYGVISSLVTQKANEIGIRVALGARRGEIASMIAKQSARLVLLGLCIGVLLTWWLTTLLREQLFEVEATDVGSYVFAAVALAVAALIATLFPAFRALRIDPGKALRID